MAMGKNVKSKNKMVKGCKRSLAKVAKTRKRELEVAVQREKTTEKALLVAKGRLNEAYLCWAEARRLSDNSYDNWVHAKERLRRSK